MVRFHGYFGNGAILQRGAPVTVKGYADGAVVVTLSGGAYSEKREAVAENGAFSVWFSPSDDVKSVFTLSARCGNEICSVSVRFGDVYLATGQSNMSYVLAATESYETWLERAAHADVAVLDLVEPPFNRLSDVTRPALPSDDFCRPYEWITGKGDLSHVSALSVQTAVLLSERRGVPVGVVHTAMGGLSVEAYLKRESVEANEEVLSFLKSTERYCTVEDYNRAGDRNYTQMCGVWNEKIAPLLSFRFDGIIWYLGESAAWNFAFAEGFRKQMNLLIGDFAERFGEIPFIAVQIAPEYYPYGDRYGYLYVNEALTEIQRDFDRVVSVPIYDIEPRWLKPNGELYFHPIHPVNKAPIAERIARALEEKEPRYPEIGAVTFGDGKAVCKIERAGTGMSDGAVRGFTLAGKDGKYYPAEALVVAPDTVDVWSEDVPEPTFVTYAFMQYQEFCDCRRKDGAPLLPYRSVKEPVREGYCFPPAYLTPGASAVYESCFGWQVGTCRRTAIWKKGEIYDASPVTVEVTANAVVCRAEPSLEKYCLFGISPTLGLSGHKSHIADYGYWNFALSADGEAEFLGVLARAADGEVFRFALYNGTEQADSVPLFQKERRLSVSLERGLRGDSAPVEFSAELRRSFVQTEFLFRAKEQVSVTLRALMLSDCNRSSAGGTVQSGVARADITLPETKG